jgi:hypothetical protein
MTGASRSKQTPVRAALTGPGAQGLHQGAAGLAAGGMEMMEMATREWGAPLGCWPAADSPRTNRFCAPGRPVFFFAIIVYAVRVMGATYGDLSASAIISTTRFMYVFISGPSAGLQPVCWQRRRMERIQRQRQHSADGTRRGICLGVQAFLHLHGISDRAVPGPGWPCYLSLRALSAVEATEPGMSVGGPSLLRVEKHGR